jgi:hypothetical protein
MKGEKEEVTAGTFILLLKLYNSKKKELERKEFCKDLGLSVNNSNTYNKVINILKVNLIVPNKFPDTLRSVKIKVDRDKLEDLILSLYFYKLTDEFIHKCMLGAITP